ncbi:hypothetical protein Tco_0566994 [Tanacetum coccineum]
MSIPHNNIGPPPARPPPPPNNGPPSVVRPNGQAPRSMEELCQPSIDGRGGPIAPVPIQATDFGLRHHMIQQQNRVSDDALHLSLFPYSLTHHAIAWYDRLPRNSIHSFDDMMRKNTLTGGTFMQKTPEECYELIENMTAHHNHWDTSATRDETHVVAPIPLPDAPSADGCVTSRAAYATTVTIDLGAPNYQAQVGPSNELTNYMKSNEATLRAMQTQMTNMKTELRNEFKSTIHARINKIENQNNQIMNILTNMQNQNSSGSGSLPSNTVANPRGDVKAITTRSGVAYDGPTIPPTPSPLPKEVERETEVTKDKVQNTSLGSTAHVQPLVVQDPIPEPEVAPKPKQNRQYLILRA